MRVRFTRRALADVIAIGEFISARNAAAGAAIETAIRKAATLIGSNPKIGVSRSKLGARALGVPRHPYTIYYRIGPDAIDILHIRDDRRRPLEPGDV